MTTGNHETLVQLFDYYLTENEKFEETGNSAAGTRARKTLMEITRICKDRRKDIQDKKLQG